MMTTKPPGRKPLLASIRAVTPVTTYSVISIVARSHANENGFHYQSGDFIPSIFSRIATTCSIVISFELNQ